jgi:GNAT superfamily N-acetyltransferase
VSAPPTDDGVRARISYVASRLRQRGVRESARTLWRLLRARLYFEDTHVWYVLDLTREVPSVPLAAGLELHRARQEDLPDLQKLPTIGPRRAERFFAAGSELWLVREGEVPAFACWIHRGRTPVLAARGGWLTVPPGVASLEDSVTSPAFRGRKIAPAAWSLVARAAREHGDHLLVTLVLDDNQAVRRALDRAGFREVASHRLLRRGPWSRVSVNAADHAFAQHLTTELTRVQLAGVMHPRAD